ncbi:Stk1 family PASTA domain-containing Ser/Thr kinase [Effusibacillus dendaii]|uniref:Serine/threonine-protein kinase PrkC n=1 Tax=Effusibacillus dendaii TaxID=2743772 RepID=A0A7I8D4S7_9BACL|nr:Stk1 family PASTA domain-containing Ser/Thr kinase [Effusibacillus dendaii]BCJ85128.1 serine/threonine protein kinase [Effusibacillus dendaii]
MIGKKLAKRYEILERIGGGGTAIVYRALDTILNRYVSVKILRSQFVSDEEFVRRFRREAQSAASLSHPNVVNIYDVGVEEETYFIVMEYINGKTLKEIIQERAPLPIAEAVDIAKQICSALQHAHDHQIVHRDIKPHNIMIGKDGHVKVTDFGIARAITSNTITHNGSVLGSVHYFSPEQARGAIIDLKSDIYSLGVVLYEMVTGELPFSGETPISVALKHLQEHFIEPRQLNPKIPQSVENIILKALAKDPDIRYQSAREMYRDLEQSLQQPNVGKFIVPDVTAYTQPTIQLPAAALQERSPNSPPNKEDLFAKQEEAKPVGWRKWLRVLGIAIGVLVLGGVATTAGYMLMTKVLAGQEVTMPKVVGMTREQAIDELKKFGFKESNIQFQELKDPGDVNRPPFEAGKVFAQDPESNKQVKNTRTVTLKISTGADTILMPNVTNRKVEEAKNELAALHWDVNSVKIIEEARKDVDKGIVFAQNPPAQVVLIPGKTQIELHVSTGPAQKPVPDLTNLTLPDALNKLQEAGFLSGDVQQEYSFTVAKDRITKQGPAKPGDQLQEGSKIDLWISRGLPPETQVRSYEVTARPDNGQPVQITIKRIDARGNQTIVNNEQVTGTKKYQVELYVTPSVTGEIDVYENGNLKDKKVIPYMN